MEPSAGRPPDVLHCNVFAYTGTIIPGIFLICMMSRKHVINLQYWRQRFRQVSGKRRQEKLRAIYGSALRICLRDISKSIWFTKFKGGNKHVALF